MVLAAIIAVAGQTIIRVNVLDDQFYNVKKQIDGIETDKDNIEKNLTRIEKHLSQIRTDIKWIAVY